MLLFFLKSFFSSSFLTPLLSSFSLSSNSDVNYALHLVSIHKTFLIPLIELNSGTLLFTDFKIFIVINYEVLYIDNSIYVCMCVQFEFMTFSTIE